MQSERRPADSEPAQLEGERWCACLHLEGLHLVGGECGAACGCEAFDPITDGEPRELELERDPPDGAA